jgi:hypothetical protein
MKGDSTRRSVVRNYSGGGYTGGRRVGCRRGRANKQLVKRGKLE